MIKWLVQTNIPGRPFEDILSYLDYAEKDVETFSFNMRDFNDPDYLNRYSNKVRYQVFGATKFIEKIDGSFMAPNTLIRFDNQIEILKSIFNAEYINHQAIIAPISTIEVTENKIIKPIGDKTFPGMVVSPEEWKRFLNDIQQGVYPDIDLNTKIMFNSVSNIKREMRFWIVNKQISTYSTYLIEDSVEHIHEVPIESIQYVESLIGLAPYIAYTLDIAQISDNKFKVIEINCINSSGIYDMDVPKLIADLELLPR